MKSNLTRVNELKWFSVLSVFVVLLSVCPFTFELYQKLLIVSLVCGIFLLGKIFIFDRRIYQNKFFPVLFLFVISYFVTILLNRHSNFFSNCGQLLYTCLYFFVFFCYYSTFDFDERRSILCSVAKTIFVFMLFIAVVSLVMLLMRYSGTYQARGTTVKIGLNTRVTSIQLTGIGTSSSILGVACTTALLAALLLMRLEGRKNRKVYITGIVVFSLTLCAANAFTQLLMLLAFAALYTICHFLMGISGIKGKQLQKRFTKMIVATVLICSAVYVSYYGVQIIEGQVLNGIEHGRVWLATKPWENDQTENTSEEHENTHNEQTGTSSSEQTGTSSSEQTGTSSSEQTGTSSGQESESNIQGNDAEKPEIVAKPDVTIQRNIKTSLTGSRLEIWKEGMKLFFEHPLGVTYSNISVKVSSAAGEQSYQNLHNGFLTILVGAGFIGFGIIMLFGVVLFIKTLIYIATNSSEKVYDLRLMTACCVAILAIDLVNGCFVLGRGGHYILLWMLLGEIYSIVWKREEVANK